MSHRRNPHPTLRQVRCVKAIKKALDAGEVFCRELIVAAHVQAYELKPTESRTLATVASGYVGNNLRSEAFRRTLIRLLFADHNNELRKLLSYG
jgi:hypothetical protein